MKRWTILLLVMLLWGCSATPAPALPTIMLDAKPATSQLTGGGVTASGVVMPEQEAKLAYAVGGKVTKVFVAIGASVEAGQILMQLDNIAALRELAQANSELAELTSPLAIANAQLAVAQAQKAFDDAELNYNDYVVDYQKGALLDAKDWLAKASSRYFYLLAHRDGSPSGQAQLQQAYEEYIRAMQAVQAAERDYETKHASGLAAAESTVAILTAQYEVAKAALAEAQAYLAALQGGEIGSNVHGAKIQQLIDARHHVVAAQERLAATQLVAPFAGIVSNLSVVAGENALPGAVLVTVDDVSKYHVETTDLSERDVPNVKVGLAVTVLVKPLNQRVAGHVRTIVPLAETLGGDIVYRVIVDLDDQPEKLFAGMSVEVAFTLGQ
jgi:multidrug efflux pump subunit AcrA (membrane-fusion protein)